MTASAISPADIQAQLSRLLDAPAFQQSGTLSRFLRFVVLETLEGRAHELKEYTIALHVLGRKPDFNPQQDPIVRIHAGRLRRLLHAYYGAEGSHDPILIEIPKGTYVPDILVKGSGQMEQPITTVVPATRRSISVAVMPFSNYNADEQTSFFADGLCDHLSTELTRYSELSVISYYSSRSITAKTSDTREAGLMLGAAYLLTGSVQTDRERLRIQVQLILTETREQLWANTYESEVSTANYFNIQDEIAWQVVSQTAGHYGAISRNIARLPSAKNSADVSVYNASFWFYHFVKDLSVEMFNKAELVMRNAVATDPDYALGWAVLGEILVGGYFMGHKSLHVGKQLHAAVEYGKTAIRIDPACQHGYQTLALAHMFLKQHHSSVQAIAEWEKIRPPEAGIMGAMGFVLICCGHYERGFHMLDDSIQLNPFYQWWFNAGLAFYYLQKGQYDNVLYWAEKMNMPDVAWEGILKLAAYEGMGRQEKTTALRQHIFQRFPFLQTHAQTYMSAFLNDDKLLLQLSNALLPATSG